MEFADYVAALSDTVLEQVTLECALSAQHGPEALIELARERLEILIAERTRRQRNGRGDALLRVGGALNAARNV